MITLVKNGVYMEVSTEQLASLFERNGYVRVEAEKTVETAEEPKTVETAAEPKTVEEPEPAKPKRRSRKKSADAEQALADAE